MLPSRLEFMSSHIFLILFEYSIFFSFCLKKLHHLSFYRALVFIAFLFFTLVCEPEISRSSHGEVLLILTVPVRRGRENTDEDVILQGILFTKDLQVISSFISISIEATT